jgi:Probable zinc-ribbon domain
MAKHRRKVPRYKQEVEEAARAEAEANRIPADASQQAPNNSYCPPLFYEDIPFTCRDCGSREVWTAEQQQWWYEVAKGTIYSTAVRCRLCRQARRGPQGGEPRTPPDAASS